MQILAIAIYNGDDHRVVRFKPGQLNVLPGWSKKGKSSLLDIAEYCLGRQTPTYPGGQLDAVTWFGLLADFGGLTAFFGRPAATAATSSQAMYVEGVDDVPAASELRPNTDTTHLRRQLGRLLGIPEDDTEAGFAQRTRATAGQALLFCFQSQDEIASASQLFHRANEEEMPRIIRDALPFFLGAADADFLQRQERLRELKRTEREVARELAQRSEDASQINVRAVALLEEAQGAGLVERSVPVLLDEAEALALLRQAVTMPAPTGDDSSEAAREAELRAELRRANLALRRNQEQRAALHGLRQERASYTDELHEQRHRLKSLGLMPPVPSGEVCPVCEQQLSREDETTMSLQAVLAELDDHLGGVRSLEPNRRRAVADLRQEAAGLRQRVRAIQDALTTMGVEAQRVASLSESERIAYVRGRISQFLEAVAPTEAVQLRLLQDQQEHLAEAIERLEGELDPSAVAGRMASALSFINDLISEWSAELGLEYTRMRLDPTRLTLFADREEGPLSLERIGSADNAVGYHLAGHAALHDWFIRRDRPVPRFLFLDQPEQAYFPESLPDDVWDPSAEFDGDDWNRVRLIYTFLHDLCVRLNGALQVIVVGHARLDDLPWFEDALVEDWKSVERGLVPREWASSAATGVEPASE